MWVWSPTANGLDDYHDPDNSQIEPMATASIPLPHSISSTEYGITPRIWKRLIPHPGPLWQNRRFRMLDMTLKRPSIGKLG